MTEDVEPPDLAAVKRLLPLVDRALAHEGCPSEIRRRVMNTLIFGHPDGPDARELVDSGTRLEGVTTVAGAPAVRVRFVCPRCGIASAHPEDIRAGYCGRCHDWTGAP